VQVGPTVGVAVAVAVFVGVDVNVAVGVFVGVNVGVGLPVGVLPGNATTTPPFVVDAIGSPSLNTKPGWKFIPGSV